MEQPHKQPAVVVFFFEDMQLVFPHKQSGSYWTAGEQRPGGIHKLYYPPPTTPVFGNAGDTTSGSDAEINEKCNLAAPIGCLSKQCESEYVMRLAAWAPAVAGDVFNKGPSHLRRTSSDPHSAEQ